MGLLDIFKKKDKNKWNGFFISDAVIGFALNCIGKSQDFAESYFSDKSIQMKEGEKTESVTTFFALLNNNIMIGLSFENDSCFKISAYLNHKAIKADVENLNFWKITHEDNYEVFFLFDEGISRHGIHIQSKIF